MAEPELSTRFVWESGLISRDLAHCTRRLRHLGQWPRSLGIKLTDSHPNLIVNSVDQYFISGNQSTSSSTNAPCQGTSLHPHQPMLHVREPIYMLIKHCFMIGNQSTSYQPMLHDREPVYILIKQSFMSGNQSTSSSSNASWQGTSLHPHQAMLHDREQVYILIKHCFMTYILHSSIVTIG